MIFNSFFIKEYNGLSLKNGHNDKKIIYYFFHFATKLYKCPQELIKEKKNAEVR